MKSFLPKFVKIKNEKGLIFLQTIFLVSIVSLLILVIITLTLLGIKNSKAGVRQISALQVAEAGINYYLWHLVHNPTDYCDGNTCTGTPPYGPFVHSFTDNTGEVIGSYTIWIAPPSITQGSKIVMCHVPPSTDETVFVSPSAVQAHLAHGDTYGPCGSGTPTGGGTVVVEAKGTLTDGNENRTIVAALGVPSFAQYAVVANDTVNHLRFGEGTEVFGPVHNNGGVRFDGIAHGLVTSALATYDDPDHSGANEPGVHTHEADPNAVFLGGRSYPVPPVDFNHITADLTSIKALAQSAGRYYGSSGSNGYHIQLKTNDRFDIYRVNSVTSSCNSGGSFVATDGIASQTLLQSNVPFPNNGIFFIEDKLWIDGQISTAKITIAAATLPSGSRSIVVNNDLKYTNYDGSDQIGLIAQRDIIIGLASEGSFSGSSDQRELRIDGAIIAQNGRVGRNYFQRSCSSANYQRDTITIFGSVATNQRYGFTWVCGGAWTIGDDCDSGYQTRNLTYDTNLTASPPPSFPTIGNYAILDWREK